MYLNYETEEKNLQVGFKPRTLSNCSEKLFHLCWPPPDKDTSGSPAPQIPPCSFRACSWRPRSRTGKSCRTRRWRQTAERWRRRWARSKPEKVRTCWTGSDFYGATTLRRRAIMPNRRNPIMGVGVGTAHLPAWPQIGESEDYSDFYNLTWHSRKSQWLGEEPIYLRLDTFISEHS